MTNEYSILIIEDNEADYKLLKQALEQIKSVKLKFNYFNNGEEGIQFLAKTGEFVESPSPHLIILDLNLPTIDGFDILKRIKNNKNTKSIPVIVYSTSSEQSDVEQSYELQANSYLTKDYEITPLFQKIANLGNFWLKTAKIPRVKES